MRYSKQKAATAKTPKPVTPQRLMNAATHYLGRFEATRARLTRVLEQKARRWSFQHDISDFEPLITETVEKCVRLDLVDDARFGALRKDQLLRKGKAPRSIGQDLRHNGLEAPLADALAGSIDVKQERRAAALLAKRRRLGPHRGQRETSAFGDNPQKQRDKEIAVCARAGHSYQNAAAVVDAESLEALERWADDVD